MDRPARGNAAAGPARPRGMGRLLVLVGLLVVAGCGDASAADPPDPARLVGWWQAGAQRVLLDADAVEVVDGCTTTVGSWRADGAGRFVVSPDSTTPCPDGSGAAPAWFAAVGGYRFDGDAAVLLDRSGAEVLRLAPTGPAPGAGRVDPARPGAGLAVAAPPPPAVPAGREPAGPDAVVGRWTSGAAGAAATAGTTGTAFAEFAPDGSWTGSDGCNGTGGAWTAAADGGFLATASAVQTLVACDAPRADVGTGLATARRMVRDGDELVALDAAGAEVLRLVRG